MNKQAKIVLAMISAFALISITYGILPKEEKKVPDPFANNKVKTGEDLFLPVHFDKNFNDNFTVYLQKGEYSADYFSKSNGCFGGYKIYPNGTIVEIKDKNNPNISIALGWGGELKTGEGGSCGVWKDESGGYYKFLSEGKGVFILYNRTITEHIWYNGTTYFGKVNWNITSFNIDLVYYGTENQQVKLNLFSERGYSSIYIYDDNFNFVSKDERNLSKKDFSFYSENYTAWYYVVLKQNNAMNSNFTILVEYSEKPREEKIDKIIFVYVGGIILIGVAVYVSIKRGGKNEKRNLSKRHK